MPGPFNHGPTRQRNRKSSARRASGREGGRAADQGKSERTVSLSRNQVVEDAVPHPMTEPGRRTPNQIPLDKRALHAAGALALFAYGLHGLWINDLFIVLPRKRRGFGGIHLHGAPAIIMWVAMFMVCLALLSVVIDHYDRRDNERHYQDFFRLCLIAALFAGGAALVVDLVLAIVRLFR
jgi:hypothetical protein